MIEASRRYRGTGTGRQRPEVEAPAPAGDRRRNPGLRPGPASGLLLALDTMFNPRRNKR